VSFYTKVRTDLGTLAIGFGGKGISRVLLPRADWNDLRAIDLAAAGLRTEIRPPRAIAKVATLLRSHLAGDARDFSGVVLDTAGSPPFALRVQRAAQAIPAGETRSYGELAALAGSPGAARAVGSAMASNPWPIIVPCHRVFARSGFGEYSAGSGVPTKLRLLWREGYRGRTSNVTFDEHEAIAHLRESDPRLGKWIDRVGPFTLQAAAPRARGVIGPIRAMSDEDIIARLTRTRGVGRWNAQMLLMFYLGRPDVLPVTDLDLRKGFAIVYGKRELPSSRTIEEVARAWSPYASVASWYLWRAVEIARYES
jgi:O-6-methylguanine DNA methyltransferase